MRSLLSFCVIVMSIHACSDPTPDTSQQGSEGGASTTSSGKGGGSNSAIVPMGSGGSATAGGTTAACNDLIADAPDYFITFEALPAPEAKGGKIIDGTYFVTKNVMYQDFGLGSGVDGGNAKVVISGDSWKYAEGWPPDDNVNPDRHTNATFTTSGKTLTLNRNCPSTASESYKFTADDSGFSLYFEDHGIPVGTVFTRQP